MKKLQIILCAASFALTGLLVATESTKAASVYEIAQDIKDNFDIEGNLFGNSVSLAFSNNSKKIVVESADRALTIFDLATGRQEQVFKHPSRFMLFKHGKQPLRFSPDDKKIASGLMHGSKGVVLLWDVTSGNKDKDFEGKGHHNNIKDLEFSSDGKKIITIERNNNGAILNANRAILNDDVAILWDVNSGKEEYRFAHGVDPINLAKFSPDGQKVVISSWHEITLWNACTGLLERRFGWDGPSIRLAEFTSDGKKIAVQTSAALDLLDVATQEVSRIAANLPLFSHIQFSCDGKKIAVYDSTLLKILDSATGQLGLDFKGTPLLAAQFSSNNKEIAVLVNNIVKRFDVETTKPLGQMTLDTQGIQEAKFSPDSMKLVTTFSHNGVTTGKIWNFNNKLIRDYFMNKLPEKQQEPLPIQHQALSEAQQKPLPLQDQALLVLLDKISKEKQGEPIELKDLSGFQNILVSMPTNIALALREYYHIADEVFVRKSGSKKADVPVYTVADFSRKEK